MHHTTGDNIALVNETKVHCIPLFFVATTENIMVQGRFVIGFNTMLKTTEKT